MNTILYVIALWVLLQLLVVWLGARIAGVRQLYRDDDLALQAHLACDSSPTGDRSLLERDRRTLRALEETPARPLCATGSLDAAAAPMAAAFNGQG